MVSTHIHPEAASCARSLTEGASEARTMLPSPALGMASPASCSSRSPVAGSWASNRFHRQSQHPRNAQTSSPSSTVAHAVIEARSGWAERQTAPLPPSSQGPSPLPPANGWEGWNNSNAEPSRCDITYSGGTQGSLLVPDTPADLLPFVRRGGPRVPAFPFATAQPDRLSAVLKESSLKDDPDDMSEPAPASALELHRSSCPALSALRQVGCMLISACANASHTSCTR